MTADFDEAKRRRDALGRTIELVDLDPYPDEPGEHDLHVHRASSSAAI